MSIEADCGVAGPRSALGSAIGCGILLGVFEGTSAARYTYPGRQLTNRCRSLDESDDGSASTTITK